jgi:hypothetical protein
VAAEAQGLIFDILLVGFNDYGMMQGKTMVQGGGIWWRKKKH